MNETIQKGKVIFAGAGPGDPELVTLKTIRYLQQADVVITDRLVSSEIINHAGKHTKVIYSGKQAGRNGSVTQLSINEIMVKNALEEKLVVRLKGGDVSIFSNILSELQALSAHSIPYEIIPGITAALGAAAYAAIPLTARGYSTAVRFLTCYDPASITDTYWKELACTEDTLVFYMSSDTLYELVVNLIKNNIAPDKLLAIVQQATTPLQQVTVVNLYDYEQKFKQATFISPSIVIIGKVVALHEKFAWFNNSTEQDFYFDPIKNIV